MLLKYKYHYGLVKMLSKNQCFEPRKNTFKAAACDIMTRRDYAERLSAKFNKEIQSDHFGQGTTLSMEGCFVEYLENGEVLAYFHSHMADKSNQDAASTHASYHDEGCDSSCEQSLCSRDVPLDGVCESAARGASSGDSCGTANVEYSRRSGVVGVGRASASAAAREEGA